MEDRKIIKKALIVRIHKDRELVTTWRSLVVTFADTATHTEYKKQKITYSQEMVDKDLKIVEGMTTTLSSHVHGGWLPMGTEVSEEDIKNLEEKMRIINEKIYSEVSEERKKIINEKIQNAVVMTKILEGKLRDVSYKLTGKSMHKFEGSVNGEDLDFVVDKSVDKDLIKNGLNIKLIEGKFGYILATDSIPGAKKVNMKKLKIKDIEKHKTENDFDIFKIKTDDGTYLHAKKEGNEPSFKEGDKIKVEVFERKGKKMFRMPRQEGGYQKVDPKAALELVIEAAKDDKKFQKKVIKALANL